MKIYRLEIWCATYNEDRWSYQPLSEFYTNTEHIEKLNKEIHDHYNKLDSKYTEDEILKFADEWHKYLTSKLVDGDGDVVDTHGYMPEIKEYNLN